MHMQCIELKQVSPAYYHTPNTADTRDFNTTAILFPYIADILFALHLVYEVCWADSLVLKLIHLNLQLFPSFKFHLNLITYSKDILIRDSVI